MMYGLQCFCSLSGQVLLVTSMSRSDDAALEINYYYLCRARGGWAGRTCGPATPSEFWARGDQVPGATRERWYCLACGSRYRESFGVIVEILGLSSPDVGHYAAAEFMLPTQWYIAENLRLHPLERNTLRTAAYPNSLQIEPSQLVFLPVVNPSQQW